MKLSITEKEKKILYYLIGILVLVLVYQFGFHPLYTKNTELKAQKIELEKDLTKLKGIKENESNYFTETKQMKKKCKEYYEQFPAMVTAQDQILYATDLEGKFESMQISSLELADTEYVTGVDDDVIKLYKAPMTLNYTMNYADMMTFLNSLTNEEQRKSIDKITLSRDEASGNLIGTMNMNAYYLTGTDKEYKARKIEDVLTGSMNIFNTSGQSGNDKEE